MTALNTRQILENNRRWVAERTADDPNFFTKLAAEHKPKFLFIGCSDARVPANVITQTESGEMFVHRNIANLVVATDNNLAAVLQYAVDVLGVEEIIVCGHERCGGVKAAMGDPAPPMVENWLTNIRTTARLHAAELEAIGDVEARYVRLIELNVIEQVYNLSRTSVVQAAWAAGRKLRLNGWVYDLQRGVLRDLAVTTDGTPATRDALDAVSNPDAARLADVATVEGGGVPSRADRVPAEAAR